ncbi:hypothetical protein HanXRQr2_Chr17g0794321 [Helianthus annuus]|uniref:Uncharacterized protein n=1 Tax=Helianthus annuus TaxID=4232 RepID=A0A9K3GTY3_HELAN|nr:hypothetical protein HanXRQr2_Chr17g0794301 [Helianthus annuus]KAF5754708.1 hypothetical protein HanXRQr2_Chr17g0794321 [Helianthus annuus]
MQRRRRRRNRNTRRSVARTVSESLYAKLVISRLHQPHSQFKCNSHTQPMLIDEEFKNQVRVD